MTLVRSGILLTVAVGLAVTRRLVLPPAMTVGGLNTAVVLSRGSRMPKLMGSALPLVTAVVIV